MNNDLQWINIYMTKKSQYRTVYVMTFSDHIISYVNFAVYEMVGSK